MNGQIIFDMHSASSVKVLVDFSSEDYYSRVANSLGDKEQSAVIGSFEEQAAVWSRPPLKLETWTYVFLRSNNIGEEQTMIELSSRVYP